MFNNILGETGFFSKLEPGKCRLTPNGQIAIKTSDGSYKTYNVEKGTLTNQSNFVFDIGDDFFFIVPTNKVRVGDIILVKGKPCCVVEEGKNQIKVIDYENSILNTVIPERHVFLGSTYFYGRITSLMGSNFKKKKGTANLFKTMMQMQMIKSMTGGSMNFMGGTTPAAGATTGSTNNSDMSGLMQMMFMSQMFGGNSGGFGDMFENMFDFDEDEDDDTETIKKLMDDEEDN